MPRSNTSPETAYPLASLGELVHWLVGVTIYAVLGLAIGMIAARMLRVRHLHWSWATVACILVAALRAPLGQLAPVLGIAALTATARSRRWHREDIEAGADLAELAAGRRRPVDLLRRVVHAIALHRRRSRGAGGWFRGEELILGRDARGTLYIDSLWGRRRGYAHTAGRRDRLGQDGHPDLDGRAGDRARDGSDRDRPEG